jgi:hypothetical protein
MLLYIERDEGSDPKRRLQFDRNRNRGLGQDGLMDTASVATHGFFHQAARQPEQPLHIGRIGKLHELSAIALGHAAAFTRVDRPPERPQPFQFLGGQFDPMAPEVDEK